MTDQLSLLPMLNELHEGNEGTIEALQESVRQNRKGDKVMKCDELKAHKAYNRWLDEEMPTPNDDLICNEVYLKDEVDAAIAELKEFDEDACLERDDNQNVIDELESENRRLKRALWLARAKRATEKADSFIDIKVTYNGVCNIDHSVYPQNNARRMLTCDEWLDVWTNVWEKCLKKAEEYK